MGEFVLIMMVALIVLGPKQLLETAKVAGKAYRELVKMAGDLRNSVDLDALTSDRKPHVPPPPPAPPPAQPAAADTSQDVTPPPLERSGPDFYADLLESAREEVRMAEAGPQPAPQPDVPETHETTEEPLQPTENTKIT
jgi:Sec-independent protein translocase protein TatA